MADGRSDRVRGATVTYEWLVGELPLAGATSTTYAPTLAALGKRLAVMATAPSPGHRARC